MSIKRYDCTNGRAQYCYGCYTMTEADDGDYVSSEDHDATIAAKDAELAGYREANAHLVGELNDALEDARKYSAARVEIARLRGALSLALDEIRECDDTDGVRAKVIDVLAAMAEVGE